MNLNKKHLFLYKSKVILLGSLIFLAGCTRVPTNSSPDASNKPATSTSSSSSDSTTSTTSSEVTGEVEVHFIDTGNSDSILIKEGKKAMLIDGGDTDDDHDLVSYLEQQGVAELEYVVASHPHADHIGGLDSVIKNFPIRYLFVANGDAETKTYQSFIQAAMDKNLTPSVPLEGKQFKLENSYFEVFNTNGGSTTNEASLVLRLTNGEDIFLFTGDAEKETELEILDQMTDVDLLKVGHHGSHSSTTDAFLSKLQPEYAVILASNPNKYGHPHIETVEKLKKAQIEVHRSDECGDIIFTSTGHGLQTECPIGSYSPGAKGGKDTSTSSTKPLSTTKPTTPQVQTPTVYWTPNGKSYHTTKDCSALAKSKTILSGTQAESGKSDPCNRCH